MNPLAFLCLAAACALPSLLVRADAAAMPSSPLRLVKGGPRYFEHPHTHWRRGLVDAPLHRSAHAPRKVRR